MIPKTVRINIFLVFFVGLASCAIPQKQEKTTVTKVKTKIKSELISGTWKCEDKLKIGELDMHFLYNETYHQNGDYKSKSTLRADFQLGKEVMAYRIKSNGFWYFSEGNQINYKIDRYDLTPLSEKYNDSSMNPWEYIPKSKSYQVTLLKLRDNELQTQAQMLLERTICRH